MGDLIDRNCAVEILRAKANMTVCVDIQMGYESAARVIENIPAVDAEPVRHGRWIQVKTAPSYHYCSYCKSTHKMTMSCNKYVLLKYCPHCGAKMN